MEKSFFSRSLLRSDILMRLLSFQPDTSWGQVYRNQETNFFLFLDLKWEIFHTDYFISKELILCLLGTERSSDMSFFSPNAQKTDSLSPHFCQQWWQRKMCKWGLLPYCLNNTGVTGFLHGVSTWAHPLSFSIAPLISSSLQTAPLTHHACRNPR